MPCCVSRLGPWLATALIATVLVATVPIAAAYAADENVTAYHGTGRHAGAYVVPGLDDRAAATAHVDTSFDGRVPGQIYAQPLYWRPSGAAHGMLLVATEINVVAALDAVTGAQLWAHRLATQVPSSHLPCGNISPIGITGTPVLDPQAGVVYVAALEQRKTGPEHFLHALSLSDGSEVSGWPVEIPTALRAKGIAFDSRIENERGALELFKGFVYVPFGGNAGDCRNYHGAVIGIDAKTGALRGAWLTRAEKGGIWSQGAVSDDGTSVFTATGNTAGATTWGDGEGVFRLPRDLAHSSDTRDYFAPSNWLDLDNEDEDLGSTGPLPIDLPQAGGTQKVILQLGKDGDAYVLDRADLGGIGQAPTQVPLVNGRITTGPAEFPLGNSVGVAMVGFGVCKSSQSGSTLLAIAVTAGSPPTVDRLWCIEFDGRGAPIVTTTDGASNPIVWVVGSLGDDKLHGYRADTGATVFDGGSKPGDTFANPAPFVTPVAAEGRLYIADDHRIRAFVFDRK